MAAISAWFENFGQQENVRKVNYSNGSIYDFKSGHRFTSRAFYHKRRPSVTIEQGEHSRNGIQDLLWTAPNDHVLDMDETSGLLWPREILTLTGVNSDHPRVLIRGGEKKNLTALATVAPVGGRLPPLFLARGKTEIVG
jgi:hypothetical protein